MPAVGLALNELGRERRHVGVRVVGVEDGLDVAAVDGVEHVANELDVRFAHRASLPRRLSCQSPMETAERAIRPAADWRPAGDYEDIRYETADGIAKVTINRPEVRNAFRPETLIEISDALERAREDTAVGVVVLTGEGPLAFCSGGDQRVRGDTGYVPSGAKVGRFHVTDLHADAAASCRSWRWWPATRWAAATCYTWSAT